VSGFDLISDFRPTGDQPLAIEQLTNGTNAGLKHQTLLGVTGSGKSVTANTPVLVRRGDVVECREIGPFVDEVLATSRSAAQHIDDTELVEPHPTDEPT